MKDSSRLLAHLRSPAFVKRSTATVVGLGRSGFAVARFLSERGARVKATDGSEKKEVLENAGYLKTLGVEIETGRHTDGFVAHSTFLVKSPGVPVHSTPIREARLRGIPVLSEIELAAAFCPGRIVAVTGSNGKTTTCNLIHRILTDAGRKSVLCGNVGYSFLGALPEIKKGTVVVLELSSFQLEDSSTLRPDIAVVLNVSPNHLDRHGSMKAYVQAKERIFKNQRRVDTLVLNAQNAPSKRMASKTRSRVVFFGGAPSRCGIYEGEGGVLMTEKGKRHFVFDRNLLRLTGDHNVHNAMAASAVCHILGVPVESIRRTLYEFTTLEHRIEPVGTVRGVRFINDSKSTTVESTRAAVLSTEKPLILICGGRDKGAPFNELRKLLDERVKLVVVYGEAGAKIAGAWAGFERMLREDRFEAAVRRAFSESAPGDSILLSPMCTSFDQFSSFEERGEVFKHLVKTLRGETGGAP